MLHYPKIPDTRNCPAGRCVAFEKYDGTNLHFDFDGDFGWHAFGTRRDAFNLTDEGVRQFHQAHPGLDDCVTLFHATLADGLEHVFRNNPCYTSFAAFQAFAEYLGPGSFAGMHRAAEPKQLVLFDVRAEGFGLIGPEPFVADFGHLRSARVLYTGRFTGQFAEDVRRGKYGVAEGVVVKGGAGGPDLWLAKIKTYAYREKLQQAFAERWQDYWE
jgi:hypothetical protein